MAGTGSRGCEPLAEFVLQTFDRFKRQREPLNEKWRRNYSAFYCDPDFDPKAPWKPSEHDQAWMSRTMSDVTRQKVLTAYSIIRDMGTRGNRLALMLKQESILAGDIPEGLDVEEALKRQEDRMQDQLDRCDGVEQYDRLALSLCVYGRAWAKRFVQDVTLLRHEPAGQREDGSVIYALQDQIVEMPAFESKSVFKIWTDLEDLNVRTNDGVIEHDHISPWQLRRLLKQPHYIDSAILSVLKNSTKSESSDKAKEADTEGPGMIKLADRRKTIPYFEFWGRAPRRKVQRFLQKLEERTGKRPDPAGGDDGDETARDVGDDIECNIVVAKNEIIRYIQTVPRDRPYYLGDFELPMDTIIPRGTADAVEELQKTITGIIRAIENNTKLTSNFTVAGFKRFCKKWAGKLIPGGFLEVDDEADDINKVFKQIVWTDVTGPLKDTLSFFMSLADLSSLVPRAQQGSQDAEPQTAFELQQRLEKAGMYLGTAIAHLDRMIEDVGRDVYVYNTLMDPDFAVVPATVKALGFTSFENRVIRVSRLMGILSFIMQHEELKEQVKLRWILHEIAIANDIAPEQFFKSPDELAQVARERADLLEQQIALQQKSGKFSGSDAAALEEMQAKSAYYRQLADKAKAETEAKQTDSLIKRADAAQRISGQRQIQPQPEGARAA